MGAARFRDSPWGLCTVVWALALGFGVGGFRMGVYGLGARVSAGIVV